MMPASRTGRRVLLNVPTLEEGARLASSFGYGRDSGGRREYGRLARDGGEKTDGNRHPLAASTEIV